MLLVLPELELELELLTRVQAQLPEPARLEHQPPELVQSEVAALASRPELQRHLAPLRAQPA